LFPHSMSSSFLVGLPISMTTASSIFPVIIYAIFGSSKHLVMGNLSFLNFLMNSILNCCHIRG
jgi:MFS superfamily sulfate permease-like transporter